MGTQKIIKSKDRIKKHGEVYTPDCVVKEMCDLLGRDTWEDIDSTFLEPAAGNGNFVVEILRRKLSICRSDAEKLRALKSIYAVELLQDNVDEMKMRVRAIMAEHGIADGVDDIMNVNVQQGNFLTHKHADGTDIAFYDWRGGTGYHTLHNIIQEGERKLFETVVTVKETKTDIDIKAEEDNSD